MYETKTTLDIGEGLSSLSTWLTLETLREQTSEHVWKAILERINWGGKIHLDWGGTVPRAGVLDWRKRRKQVEHQCSSLYFLSMNSIWQSPHIPAVLPSPPQWAVPQTMSEKWTLFSYFDICQIFDHSNKKKLITIFCICKVYTMQSHQENWRRGQAPLGSGFETLTLLSYAAAWFHFPVPSRLPLGSQLSSTLWHSTLGGFHNIPKAKTVT